MYSIETLRGVCYRKNSMGIRNLSGSLVYVEIFVAQATQWLQYLMVVKDKRVAPSIFNYFENKSLNITLVV